MCPCAEPEKLVSIADCRLLFFFLFFVFVFLPFFFAAAFFVSSWPKTLGKASKSCREAAQRSASHGMRNAFRFLYPVASVWGESVYGVDIAIREVRYFCVFFI